MLPADDRPALPPLAALEPLPALPTIPALYRRTSPPLPPYDTPSFVSAAHPTPTAVSAAAPYDPPHPTFYPTPIPNTSAAPIHYPPLSRPHDNLSNPYAQLHHKPVHAAVTAALPARDPPLSAPLYHHPQQQHQQHQHHATVSPLSPPHPYDSSALCVSPLSMSAATAPPPPPPIPVSLPDHYSLPAASPRAAAPPVRRIDDSLIARLRGFSDRPILASASAVSGSVVTSAATREPQIRDTTESLAGGFTDAYAVSTEVDGAPQPVPLMPDRPHACRKCSATFRRRDNLMAHIRAQHKGERPFKCEVCGFRFIKKDHAMKHWKVVHLKERPFTCNRCNSRFGQRSDLNKHVRSVHLRIKPFECQHCGLRFSHRGNQIRHQAVVHEKRKPYVCTECDSSFAEKSNLVKHCQAVHKNGTYVGSTLRTRL